MCDLDNAKVGDGATWTVYSDAHAGTIIERNASTIKWQRDQATLLNRAGSSEPDALTFTPGGFCGHTSGVQRYDYERDPNGEVRTFRKRKNGNWKLEGSGMRERGNNLRSGRHEYYDFNF